MSGEINELSQAIGRIEQKVDNLADGFKLLPCSTHQQKIEDLVEYKNKAIGMAAIIGTIAGLIGFFLSPIISWFLERTK